LSDDSEWSELSIELSEIDKPPCTNLSKEPTVNEHEHTELLDILRLNLVPEITDAEMADMQAEDPNLGPIIEWLETNQIPNLETLKAHSLEVRILWAQVLTVHLLDGILVRKPFEGPGVQLVIPHAIRKRLFEMVHAGPLAAHLGAQRVLLQMKPVYYWPGMKKDIQIWYKQCDTCARSRGPQHVIRADCKKC